MKILLGSDPELFVIENGKPISAHGMVNGTKEKPLVVKRGAVQVDGMALEYNTDPASTLRQWEANHTAVQSQMLKMIKKGLTLEPLATAFFSEEVFNTTPKESLILGCEPDFNAYTEDVNPQPNAEVKFRTGAGHIHIGWTENADIEDDFHLGECYALVKHLDLHLGLPSLFMDKDTDRRKLYGKAGCFRPKSYGLEYRTLSNFWVGSRELRAWAFNNTHTAINCALDRHSRIPSSYIQSTIDDNDLEDADYYIRDYGVNYLGELNGRF